MLLADRVASARQRSGTFPHIISSPQRLCAMSASVISTAHQRKLKPREVAVSKRRSPEVSPGPVLVTKLYSLSGCSTWWPSGNPHSSHM